MYGKMRDKSTQLLSKFGRDISLIDGTKTVLETFKGLDGEIKEENLPQSIIERTVKVMYLSAGTLTPTVDHYIQAEGEIWKIIWVKDYSPAGLSLLTAVYLSK